LASKAGTYITNGMRTTRKARCSWKISGT